MVALPISEGVKKTKKIGLMRDGKARRIIREGEKHRKEIMEIISQNEEVGICPNELEEQTELSRQAVHTHLKMLSSEERIYKKRNGKKMLYFPRDNILNDTDLFTFTMADRLVDMIDKELVSPLKELDQLKSIPAELPLYQYPNIDYSQLNPNPGPRNYFLKAISGNSVSDDYYMTRFTNDNITERNLFEFVNRVGAYIAYIFIELLRPLPEWRSISKKKKQDRIYYLVDKAVPVVKLFRKFCLLLGELGVMKSAEDSYMSEKDVFEELELDQSSYEKLSISFRKVYPKVYEALEN